MRIGLFSDMHGNAVALEAVLNDVAGDGIDLFVCLGDAVQGGPQPAETVARLRALGCKVVMGNADDWLLTGVDSGAENIDLERQAKMDAVRQWQLDRLSEADLVYIRAFQPTVTLALDDTRNLVGFHGSPHSFDDVILPDTPAQEVKRLLGGFEPNILAGGHTHVQQIHHLKDSFYVGVGSAGFAYRRDQQEGVFRADPWAEYAVLTIIGGRIRLEFRRVPFDTVALITAYQVSGRPYADDAVAQYQ